MKISYKGYIIESATYLHDEDAGCAYEIVKTSDKCVYCTGIIVGGADDIETAKWKIDNHIGIYDN